MNGRRKLASLIIWWCEGTRLRKDKRWKNAVICPIEVTNTNPDIIKLFLSFLIEEVKVDQKLIHGRLQIHEGDDQKKLEQFRSEVTGISLTQFNKTIIRNAGNKIGKTRGTFTVRLYNKKVFDTLQTLLTQEIKEITGSSSVG